MQKLFHKDRNMLFLPFYTPVNIKFQNNIFKPVVCMAV